MKGNCKLLFGVLTGVAIGMAGAMAIHASQVKKAPGYVIAEVEVTNPAALDEYGKKVPTTVAAFDGRDLVRGGKTRSLEGEPPKKIVIIAFDSVEKAQAWYDSPAYAAIKPIRQRATKSRLFIAEGVAPH